MMCLLWQSANFEGSASSQTLCHSRRLHRLLVSNFLLIFCWITTATVEGKACVGFHAQLFDRCSCEIQGFQVPSALRKVTQRERNYILQIGSVIKWRPKWHWLIVLSPLDVFFVMLLLFGQALVSPIISGLHSYQKKSCQLVVTVTSPTRSLGSVLLGGSGVLSCTIPRKWKHGGHLYQ